MNKNVVKGGAIVNVVDMSFDIVSGMVFGRQSLHESHEFKIYRKLVYCGRCGTSVSICIGSHACTAMTLKKKKNCRNLEMDRKQKLGRTREKKLAWPQIFFGKLGTE